MRKLAPEEKKILIVRFSSLGDILLATPLIRCLRQSFPQAVIDFAIREKFSELLKNNPHLNEILILREPADYRCLQELSRKVHNRNYSDIIDLQSNFRSFYLTLGTGVNIYRGSPPRIKRTFLIWWKVNLLHNALPVPLRYLSAVAKLGVKDDGHGLEFFISEEFEAEAQKVWKELKLFDKRVGSIAPGAKWFTKCWGAKKYIELGTLLLKDKCDKLLILGSSEEKLLCEEVSQGIGTSTIDISGKTDLVLAGALIKKCQFFIGNDSGLSHLASAVETPVVVIFGPTVKEFGFYPFRSKSVVVEKEISCRPCSHIGSKYCPEKHFNCMNSITVEQVLSALEKL
jgi:heptosyltransferase-2